MSKITFERIEAGIYNNGPMGTNNAYPDFPFLIKPMSIATVYGIGNVFMFQRLALQVLDN